MGGISNWDFPDPYGECDLNCEFFWKLKSRPVIGSEKPKHPLSQLAVVVMAHGLTPLQAVNMTLAFRTYDMVSIKQPIIKTACICILNIAINLSALITTPY